LTHSKGFKSRSAGAVTTAIEDIVFLKAGDPNRSSTSLPAACPASGLSTLRQDTNSKEPLFIVGHAAMAMKPRTVSGIAVQINGNTVRLLHTQIAKAKNTHMVTPGCICVGCCGWPGMPPVIGPEGMGGTDPRVIVLPTLAQDTWRHLSPIIPTLKLPPFTSCRQ
jgi:hypothetical protein